MQLSLVTPQSKSSFSGSPGQDQKHTKHSQDTHTGKYADYDEDEDENEDYSSGVASWWANFNDFTVIYAIRKVIYSI